MGRVEVTSADQVFDHFLAAYQRQPDRIRSLHVYPDYHGMGSDQACHRFNQRMVEAAGAVELKWKPVPAKRYIERVTLRDALALYALLGRQPPSAAPLSPAAQTILAAAAPNSDEERAGWIAIAQAVDPDWPQARLPALVAELKRIAAEPPDRPAFLVSAAGTLASSKLLDRLPQPALRRIGIRPEAYPAPPVVLLTAGAARPDAVILVENPRAFERAFAVTTDLPVAWVSTHGLVATSVARALEGRWLGAPVDGSPPPLDTLLTVPNLFYWGDLDLAGLMIFATARRRLPQIALSALYRPMVELLAAGGGHPYSEITDKAGQRPWRSDDPLLQSLLEACAGSGVDQEWVAPALIRDLCALPYSHPAGPV